MTMTNFDKAQLLWRARDEMVWAAEEYRAAEQMMTAVAADMAWQSDAARGFRDAVGDLVAVARGGVVGCWDEADALLAAGNRMAAQ